MFSRVSPMQLDAADQTVPVNEGNDDILDINVLMELSTGTQERVQSLEVELIWENLGWGKQCEITLNILGISTQLGSVKESIRFGADPSRGWGSWTYCPFSFTSTFISPWLTQSKNYFQWKGRVGRKWNRHAVPLFTITINYIYNNHCRL